MLGLIAYLVICAVISLITMRYEDMTRGNDDSAIIVMFLIGIVIAPICLVYFLCIGLAKGIRKIVEK